MGGEIVSTAEFSVPPERRGIGMVFQSYAVWPHMSVLENVTFGLKVGGKFSREQIAERARAALDLVGLGALEARGINQLSGGQQQRVALARAVVLEPKVLLFDEPLSNLDAQLREHMRFELRALQQRLGITSIYVTHDQQEAMVVADRIALMRAGTIEQIGSPREVYDRPASLFAAEFVGLTNSMRGEIVEVGATARVRLESGHLIASGTTHLAAGTRVEVVCRPERVRISSAEPAGENRFAARIEELAFLGNMSDVVLRLGELRLRSQVSPPLRESVGDEVWAQFAPEAVLLLPERGGRA
jgi:ABC-type Fe3+/spermidine/putrescine transport system ATPase subunit